MNVPILFADKEWIGLVLFLVFALGGWLIRQLGQMGEQQMQQRRAEPRPQPAEPQAEEVEDFLRRAAEQRGEGRPGDIEIIDAYETEPVDAMVIEDRPSSLASQLPAGDLSSQTGVPGAEGDLAKPSIEHHLRETSDRQIGSLAGGDTATDDAHSRKEEELPAVSAAGIAKALANPQDIRRAIILGEILSPPADRWS